MRWSNTDIWDRFASETNANFYFSGSSVSSSWTAAQVLLPFACAFVLLALIMHCAVEKVGASIETKLRCLIWGGNLVMLSWIVGLFSINFSANSASASASAWESFYSSGHNIVNLLDSNAPVGPPNAGCSVGIFLTGAGIALSIALPVAFFMSISILISACCFLSVYSFDTGPSSGSLYRPGSYGVSGVPRASTGAREYHVTYSEECRMEDVPSYQNQSAPAPVTRTIVHTETKEGGTGTAVAQPYGSTSLA